MKNLERLRSILKSVESVKENMEKLDNGCVLKKDIWYNSHCDDAQVRYIKAGKYLVADGFFNNVSDCYAEDNGLQDTISVEQYEKDIYIEPSTFETIGAIKERHLFMYCNSKGINIIKNRFNQLEGIKSTYPRETLYKKITKLNNTLDLDKQSEETLGKICDFLENNK